MIWKLLPQIAAIFSLVIVTALDYFWYDRRTTRFKTARHILLWVILVFMLLTVLAVWIDEGNGRAEKAVLQSQITGLRIRLNEIHDIESAAAARASMKPQFKIFLGRENSTNRTELTEGCLVLIPVMAVTNGPGGPGPHFSIHNPASAPWSIDVPMPSGSDSAPMQVGIQNVGSAPAKGLQATFYYENRVSCEADWPWISLLPGQTWRRAGTNAYEIKCRAVGYHADHPLFQPSGVMLPTLRFLPGTNLVLADGVELVGDGTNWQASLHRSLTAPKQITMSLELQTEETLRACFSFSTIFYLSAKTTDPYVADGPPDTNGNVSIVFH